MTDKPDVEKWLWHLAASLDHPSVFMGGPSERNKKRAREAFASFLRAAAADGYTLVRVPDEMPLKAPAGPVTLGVTNGWNGHRAATLASAVEVGE